MQPLFNVFPSVHSQTQSNGTVVPLHQQQGFQSNPSLGNSCAMLPHQMQVMPQIGPINPQLPVPFGGANISPLMAQAGFMNAPTQPFLQNNHLGVPQGGAVNIMSQPGQCNVGIVPQLGVPDLSKIFMGHFCHPMQNANQVNPSQLQGQFMHNSSNMPQQFNQIMGLQNRQQFPLQNLMQNMSQFVPMQMPNHPQGVPCGPPPSSQQLASPNFFGNPQFGLLNPNQGGQHLNQNQQNLVQPTMDVNALKSPQVQENSHTPYGSSVQPQQNQNLQSSPYLKLQGQPVKNGHVNNSNSNGRSFLGKKFARNPKSEPSKRGFEKPQFHPVDNPKRKFGFPNGHRGKGHGNERPGKLARCDSENPRREKNRSLALTYTEQEIQQWREERRKNYPSKANIDKKLNERLAESNRREAKIRREQLKEILAKQAELGVEVAEIPSHYLSDSEKQVSVREENSRPLTKRDRFQNKHDTRGRYNKKDKFAKKQKLKEKDPSNGSSFNMRKPTLLEKLLSADIKRDKCHLLQVFRFMVMNSFFKDWPEKSLKFPSVVVKESGSEAVEEIRNDVSHGSNKIVAENLDDDDGDDAKNNAAETNDECNKLDAQVEQVAFAKRLGSTKQEIGTPEEEEGEIID